MIFVKMNPAKNSERVEVRSVLTLMRDPNIADEKPKGFLRPFKVGRPNASTGLKM